MLSNVVYYVDSVCNLNCKYCVIDKNKALSDIDKIIENSFADSDYYYNKTKEWFPDPKQLKTVEFWGGEPTLFLKRSFNLLDRLIDFYPLFNTIFFSTNFVGLNWTNNIFELLDFLSGYPDREFNLELQLSCDGPAYINDANRGNNVTKMCLTNFKILLNHLPENLAPNVKVHIHLKPTLTVHNIAQLQTREKVFEYYHFFEQNFYQPLEEHRIFNVDYTSSLPNMASPEKISQQDGINFANFCKICHDLNEENALPYFNNVIPYRKSAKNDELNLYWCGAGIHKLGIMPNNKLALCNVSFLDLLGSYKEYAKSPGKDKIIIDFSQFLDKLENNFSCINNNEFGLYQQKLDLMSKKNSNFILKSYCNIISCLAEAGLISSKFKINSEAQAAAELVYRVNVFCIKNNLDLSSSLVVSDYNIFIFLLNGAEVYISE